MMQYLIEYVTNHPWWTLVYLLIVADVVSRVFRGKP